MKIFDVDVIQVRTMVVAPKRGRRYRSYYIRRKIWKKAVVSLPQGQTIGIFHA
jgi:ribosomal protein L23